MDVPELVTIRPASLDDAVAVSGLIRELGYEATPASARARLERLLGASTEAVLVSVAGSAVAGWIHLSHVGSLESDEFVEIRGLVVGEPFRSCGIGAQLVAAAEEWARARHVIRVRVRSNIIRVDARRFYERLHYAVTKTQNVFDKRLEGQEAG